MIARSLIIRSELGASESSAIRVSRSRSTAVLIFALTEDV